MKSEHLFEIKMHCSDVIAFNFECIKCALNGILFDHEIKGYFLTNISKLIMFNMRNISIYCEISNEEYKFNNLLK